MCRFLIVKTKEKRNMNDLLAQFAVMAERSRTSDGDRQGDGWGVSWWSEKEGWTVFKSLNSVWEDRKKFSRIPKTNLIVVHARSATNQNTKGNISFNQPYVQGEYAYIFNGHLKGVRIKEEVEGKIGAEKIWYLIKKRLKKTSVQTALGQVHNLLKGSTKEIFGMNVGLVSPRGAWIVSAASKDNDYFTLRQTIQDDIFIICSETIGNFAFETLPKDRVLEYNLN